MRARTRLLAGAAVTSLALLAGACGGGGGTTTPGTATNAGTPVKGGVLNMLGVGDVDYMDPQSAYYSGSYMLHRLWSRQLYTYPADPAKNTVSVPDLADGPVQTSEDGLTVTIKLRDGGTPRPPARSSRATRSSASSAPATRCSPSVASRTSRS
jgi:peptide/nickel transport system substrate-binding protein